MRRILLAAFTLLTFAALPSINLPGCAGRKLIVRDPASGVIAVSHNCANPIVIGHPRRFGKF